MIQKPYIYKNAEYNMSNIIWSYTIHTKDEKSMSLLKPVLVIMLTIKSM